MENNKIIFLLAISFNVLCIGSVESAGFGEPCNQTDPTQCDPLKYLHCGFTSNVCECANTLQTWYDPWDQVCKILVGSQCSRDFPGQACVQHAYCPDVPNPTCRCDQEYEENTQRQCFLGHSSQCTIVDADPRGIDRCDPAGFLQCTLDSSGYFCKCRDFEDAEYFPLTRTCHLLANATCLLPPGSMPCIGNAHCDVNDRKCRCDEAYLNTPSRKCHLGHGTTCNPWVDTCNIAGHVSCHPDLEKCLCTPYGESIYYEGELGCRLLENTGCSVVEGSQRCINDATCIPSEGAEPRRCKCNNNLSPNKNRECYLTHGDRCDLPQDYCDPAGFLGCANDNNLCGCKNTDSFYDSVAKECRYELGAKCKPGLAEQPCGNNAVCDSETEICRCENQYEDAGNGNCLRSFRQPCSAEEPCNSRNQLACYNGICECIPGFLGSSFGSTNYEITCLPGYMQKCPYDEQLQLPCAPEAMLNCIGGVCTCSAPGHHVPEEERCAVLVGNDCIPSPDNTTNVCVTNAYCETSGFLPGKCICELGYRVTFTGLCVSGGITNNIGMVSILLSVIISLKST